MTSTGIVRDSVVARGVLTDEGDGVLRLHAAQGFEEYDRISIARTGTTGLEPGMSVDVEIDPACGESNPLSCKIISVSHAEDGE